VRVTYGVQALQLLQLCAELDAVVLFPLQSFLQALSLLPLSAQLILQTQPESRGDMERLINLEYKWHRKYQPKSILEISFTKSSKK